MPIFDTHAHYDDSRFDGDRDAVLAALPEAGVELVLDPGCDLPSSRPRRRWQSGTAMYTPPQASTRRTARAFRTPIWRRCGSCWRSRRWRPSARSGWTTTGRKNPPRDFQQMVFRKQLALAEELDLPVIVHDREAHGDSLSIIREFPAVTGVFHCFSGSPEMAEELLKRGWYLGFDGPITYKNARRAPEVAAITPLERMVVETDAPLPVAGAGAGQAERQPVSAPRHCKAGGVEGRHAGGNDPHHL